MIAPLPCTNKAISNPYSSLISLSIRHSRATGGKIRRCTSTEYFWWGNTSCPRGKFRSQCLPCRAAHPLVRNYLLPFHQRSSAPTKLPSGTPFLPPSITSQTISFHPPSFSPIQSSLPTSLDPFSVALQPLFPPSSPKIGGTPSSSSIGGVQSCYRRSRPRQRHSYQC